MALIVQVAPTATNLTVLYNIKIELDLPDTSYDLMLNEMIARASTAIARECGRPYFGYGTYLETLKGSGSQLLGVTSTPIVAIASIYQDTDLLSPINPSNPNDPNLTDGYYVEDTESGAIYRPGGWGQSVALMSWGWEAYSSRYILPGGTQTLRYTVTYTAGYVLPGQAPISNVPLLPGSVEEACIITVKSWYLQRKRDISVASLKTADQQIAFSAALSQTEALPFQALGLLRDYRRPVS